MFWSATARATTGLWLFRLSSAWATPEVLGKLTAPVAALSADQQELFRARLVALPDEIEVLPLRHIAWPMALLQHRHRIEGRPLSAAMAEALTVAHALGCCDRRVQARRWTPTSRPPPGTIKSHSTSCRAGLPSPRQSHITRLTDVILDTAFPAAVGVIRGTGLWDARGQSSGAL